MTAPGHVPLPAFAAWAGPRDARIVFVGEAWGQSESETGQPLVGSAGKEFWRMLGDAWPEVEPETHRRIEAAHRYGNTWIQFRHEWMAQASIAFTNVLAFRPPGNQLDQLCGPKAEVGKDYPLPAIARAMYLRSEYLTELTRLHEELNACQPNLVVALGNTACWALLRATNIGSIRGNVTESASIIQLANFASGNGWRAKVLPTYHPAAVLRQWSWRSIVLADLMKARREGEFPEIRRPARRVLVDPTLTELTDWTDRAIASRPAVLAADIETGIGQIKCISFAYGTSEALVVPFMDSRQRSGSFWPDQWAEVQAWRQVRRLLESPIPKLGQNFLYDLQYLLPMGIRPANCTEDTMLLHHSHFPEMQKGLGFLASIYSDELSWKLMRRQRADTEKRDE